MTRRMDARSTVAFALACAVAGGGVGLNFGGSGLATALSAIGAGAAGGLGWWWLAGRRDATQIDQALGAGALGGALAPLAALALAAAMARWAPGAASPGHGPGLRALPVLAILLPISGALGGLGVGALVFWLGPGRAESATDPQ
jgi:hypothetical protein